MDSSGQKVSPSPKYEECCICYDPTRERLGCEHSVCVDCLHRMRKAECPVCRRELHIPFDDGRLLAMIFQKQFADENMTEMRNIIVASAIASGMDAVNAYRYY